MASLAQPEQALQPRAHPQHAAAIASQALHRNRAAAAVGHAREGSAGSPAKEPQLGADPERSVRVLEEGVHGNVRRARRERDRLEARRLSFVGETEEAVLGPDPDRPRAVLEEGEHAVVHSTARQMIEARVRPAGAALAQRVEPDETVARADPVDTRSGLEERPDRRGRDAVGGVEVAEVIAVEPGEAVLRTEPEESLGVETHDRDAVAREAVGRGIDPERQLLGGRDPCRGCEPEGGGELRERHRRRILRLRGPVGRAVLRALPDGHLRDARPAERARGLEALGEVAREILGGGVAAAEGGMLVDVGVVELLRDRPRAPSSPARSRRRRRSAGASPPRAPPRRGTSGRGAARGRPRSRSGCARPRSARRR